MCETLRRSARDDAIFDRTRRPLRFGLGAVAIVLSLGILDYATGTELRVFPVYFIPVSIAALRVSRAFGLVMAALSTAVWGVSNLLAGMNWSVGVWTFNVIAQGLSFGLVAILISEIARRAEIERVLSRTDALTSLPNRRGFHESAELLFAIARRSRRPITIAYIDLDNFKMLNDTLGHDVGDQVLVESALALRSATRASDVAARLGGDEFVLLLPDTGPEPARIVLDRFEEMLRARMQRQGWLITASVGAKSFVEAPIGVDVAMRDADALMYRVKKGGRGRALLEIVEGACAEGPVRMTAEAG